MNFYRYCAPCQIWQCAVHIYPKCDYDDKPFCMDLPHWQDRRNTIIRQQTGQHCSGLSDRILRENRVFIFVGRCYDLFADCAQELSKNPSYCVDDPEAIRGCRETCGLCGTIPKSSPGIVVLTHFRVKKQFLIYCIKWTVNLYFLNLFFEFTLDFGDPYLQNPRVPKKHMVIVSILN